MNGNNLRVCLLCLLPALLYLQVSAANDLSSRKLDCVIQPNATIKIGSADEGIIDEFLVTRGDHVKKGDLLARLDIKLEQLAAEQAKLRADTDVEIRLANTQLGFRMRETRRALKLSVNKHVSDADVDKAKVEEQLDRLSVESAKFDYKTAQIEYQRAKERLERRSIHSPVDAVIVDVEMSAGEYAHEQAHLLTMAVVDPLFVEVFVPVTYYGQVTKGMMASVVPEDPVGGSYEAEVIVVDQVFDPASRTFGVRLLLPNSDYQLPGGLRCKVRFKKQITNAN